MHTSPYNTLYHFVHTNLELTSPLIRDCKATAEKIASAEMLTPTADSSDFPFLTFKPTLAHNLTLFLKLPDHHIYPQQPGQQFWFFLTLT